ncbi:hypothetical protein [Kamptonema formosum]|nr:hypothetical protein [Oscillatoria sp. PCC 10802]
MGLSSQSRCSNSRTGMSPITALSPSGTAGWQPVPSRGRWPAA